MKYKVRQKKDMFKEVVAQRAAGERTTSVPSQMLENRGVKVYDSVRKRFSVGSYIVREVDDRTVFEWMAWAPANAQIVATR